MARLLVSVVIPTMNEEASIGLVLDEVREAFDGSPYDREILVVDTLSTDGTVALAEARGARVVREDRRGYGRAYMTGFQAARGAYVATLDADATYPARTIPALVTRAEAEGWEFLSGDRMTTLSREAMEVPHRLGNLVLNLAVRLLYSRTLRDSQSGMWIVRRPALRRLTLLNEGMPFSEEIKLEALAKDLRFAEVPIRYRPRVGKAKIRAWADGWANLRYLVERRLTRPPRPRVAPPSTSARRG